MDNDLMVKPPTPVFILSFAKDGAIADVSSDYFAEQPSFYGIRNVVHADFDGSGKQGLFFRAMGREVGDPTQHTDANPPTPPMKPWQASGDPLLAGEGRFFSAAGKLTHDGYGDIVIGHTVSHGGPGPIDFTSYSTLAVHQPT